MAVDTPATITIAGLNPLGLESALYARFLGYQVELIGDSDSIQWANDQNWVTKDQHVTPLGCQAIAAQNRDFDPEECLAKIVSTETWNESYLDLLANSDLLIDSIVSDYQVLKVELVEDEFDEEEIDEEDEICTTVFELTVRQADAEKKFRTDVLIDVQDSDDCGFNFSQQLNAEFREGLFTTVDDFYVLGPRRAQQEYRHQTGLLQIRDLFKIIADRETLDLYA